MTATPQDHLAKAPKTLTFDIDGKKITLPNLIHVKPGVLRDASKQSNDFDKMWTLIEAVADEKTLKVIKDLDAAPWGELMSQWQQGAQLPESPSSAN